MGGQQFCVCIMGAADCVCLTVCLPCSVFVLLYGKQMDAGDGFHLAIRLSTALTFLLNNMFVARRTLSSGAVTCDCILPSSIRLTQAPVC